MARKPLPKPDVPVIDPRTGRVTTIWFDYFQSLERLALDDLADVAAPSPANGQALIFNATTNTWEPGAN